MLSTRAFFLAATASMSLAACVQYDDGSVFQHLSIRGDTVVAHSRAGTDAIIASSGDLSIDGKPVQITPAQRKLLQGYNRDVLALRTDGIATGKQGARTGAAAIGAVIEGLGSGRPDEIDAKVERQASQVEALASKICLDLAGIRSAQEAIVGEIPAFKSYATIEIQQVKDCQTKTATKT